MTFTLSTAAALDDLAAALPGQVIRPGDEGWDQARSGFALAVDQRPDAVVHVQDAADVVTAVRFAARHGLTVSAQPVGHGATVAVNGTILLRTRALQEISIDAERRVARVGAGVKWGELLAESGRHGLTGLAGSSGDPTVVGFCLGGGLSWYGRKHGLAAHSVVAVDIVDAHGEQRRVTAESDPDLFWAIRGAGGDFGIVTAIEIALYEAPHVYGGRILWPLEMARPVLRAFRAITETAPDELTLWTHLLQFPPMPQLPEFIRGKSFVSVEAAYLGSAEEAEALLAPLREIPAMYADTMGTVEIAALDTICAEPTDPMPTVEYSELLDSFEPSAIDALVDVAGAGSQSALTIVQVRHLGGAIARGTADQGPSGAVEQPYLLFCLGVPMTPEIAQAVGNTIAAVQDALAAERSGRTFYTFLCADDDPTRAFEPHALARLRSLKQAVDPGRVIRSNRPV